MAEDIHMVPREKHSYYVGHDVPPALEINSGDAITFQTLDCFSGVVKKETDCFPSYAESMKVLPGWNPITGPVYINGAKPGDCLSIEILKIDLDTQGVTSYVPKLGMFASGYQLTDDLAPDTRVCRIEDGSAYLPTSKGEIAIPISPLIGTISVAPARERIASFKYGAEHLGNVDCKQITVGNTLILPVNTEGALFGLGDVHAVQGDGEISCVAIETTAEVTVKIKCLSTEEAQYTGTPQINSSEFIGSIGCHFGNPIGENIKYAYYDLLQRLIKYYGFTPIDAYHLLCQTGELTVCQVLGDFQACSARIKKCFIE